MSNHKQVTDIAFNRFWTNLKNIYLPNNYVAKEEGKSLSDKNFTEDLLNKLNDIEEGANAYTHPTSGVITGTYKSITLDENGHITNGTNPTTLEGFNISEVPSSLLTGTINIDRLPQAAIERCVVVTTDDERFNLTKDDVQIGDTVKVSSTMQMYFVKDDNKLSSEDGYEPYKVGLANSVEWINILNKPEEFTPSSHTNTVSEIIDFPISMINPNEITFKKCNNRIEGSSILYDNISYNGEESKSLDISNEVSIILSGIMKGLIGLPEGVGIMSQDDVDLMMNIGRKSGLYNDGVLTTSWADLIATNKISVNGNKLISANGDISGELVIDTSISSIGDYALSQKQNLIGVTIPSTVTSISRTAFNHDTFDTNLFVNNSSLDAVQNNYWGANICTIQDGFYMSASDPTKLITYKGTNANVIIPDGVQTICEEAFMYNDLTSVVFPSSLKKIDNSAFYACMQLSSITFNEGLTTICYSAFYGCDSLTSINLPSTLTTIESSAFEQCSNLQTLELPNSVRDVGDSAFAGCLSLTTVKLSSRLNYIPSRAFRQCSDIDVVDFGGVTSIDSMAFQMCYNANISIPDQVMYISDDAFDGVAHIIYHGEAEGAPWGAYYIN